MPTTSEKPKPTYKKHPAEDYYEATREERASSLAKMPEMISIPYSEMIKLDKEKPQE